MLKIHLSALSFIVILGGSTVVNAQADVGIKPNFAGGEVSSLSDSAIGLQTKDGPIDAILTASTVYKRVPPENPTLKAAVESNFTEIGVGDKILVTGAVAADRKTIPAKTVYLITKSDIAKRLAKENEEWKARGIAGKVVSVDPLSKEITITSRSMAGETKTVITPKDTISYRRYAQDSVKFSETNAGSLGAISPGDMLRALGDKGENGTFKAEVIVTGAFQTTAGVITAIDVEKSEITVNDIQTKKPVMVSVGKSSIMKAFPPEVAQRMAMIQSMQANGGVRPPGGEQGGARPPQGSAEGKPGGNSPGGPGGGRGMGGGSIDDMLERFPNISLGDLKVGDSIAVSSSRSSAASRITAIKLLSGVEAFLKVPEGGASRPARGGQPAGQDFNIPGLDIGLGNQ